MAWPTDTLTTDNVDQGTDNPRRSDFFKLFEIVKGILAARAQPQGVCDLNDQGRVPEARMPELYATPIARGKFLGVEAAGEDFPVVGMLGGEGFASAPYQRLATGHYRVTLANAVDNWETAQVERSGHLKDNFFGVPINCYADFVSPTEIEVATSADVDGLQSIDAYFTLVVWPGFGV